MLLHALSMAEGCWNGGGSLHEGLAELLALASDEFLPLEGLPLADLLKLLDLLELVLHLFLLLVMQALLPLVSLDLNVDCPVPLLFCLEPMEIEGAPI